MASKKKHLKDPGEWLIKRNRDDQKHTKNCKKGYRKKGYCQIHHIICISCLQDANIAVPSDQLEFIRNCLSVTDWDINASPNCIGLPLKAAYYLKPRDAWDGMPCHQIDHNPYYTEGVKDWLRDNVWEALVAAREECQIDVTDLVGLLESASTHWHSFLTARGNGTKHCWQNRHDPEMKDTWYIPFSMHPGTPPKRMPPPDFKKLSGSMQNLLKKMFQVIK